MAGIYIHIPFCTQACHYCDFHFTTSYRYQKEIIAAIEQETKLRKSFLSSQKIGTIYFGGGTPGSIPLGQLQKIIESAAEIFDFENSPEITLEINPDNVKKEWIKTLKTTSFNRFSIGIQSFFDLHLKWMNRSHSAKEAEYAVKSLQDAGFDNISIDLIYGFDLMSDEQWLSNLNTFSSLQINHLSAYSLTVEEKTPLAKSVRLGFDTLPDSAHAANHFEMLMKWAEENDFEHYEISNLAKSKQYSKHNTAYWQGVPYLGLGPSAHSFDGENRYYNVANNLQYIKGIDDTKPAITKETDHAHSRLNDLIYTQLRTQWGLKISEVLPFLDTEKLHSNFQKQLHLNLEKHNIRFENETIILTNQGKLIADRVASDFFII